MEEMKTSDMIALASAVVAFLALVVTIVFAVLGRRYTKTQIKQVTEQIEQAKEQFLALNTPDVEIHVHCQLNPPEKRGVWLKATNHHPTITVNDLVVFAVGDSPTEKEAFTFMFLTFDDLKPMQTVSERSPQDLENTLRKHFPDYDTTGATIADKLMADSFDGFPMNVHYSYMPRLHGAQTIEGVQELLFQVMRGKKI